MTNAQLILPSRDQLQACEAAEDSTVAVNMEPGTALAIWRDEEEKVRATVIFPEGDEDSAPADEPVLFTLRGTAGVDADIERAPQDNCVPLLAQGHSDTVANPDILFKLHSWLHSGRAHELVDDDIRQSLISTVQTFVHDVADRTGDMDFERSGLMMNVLANMDGAPTPQGLDRYLEARVLRERIRQLDPDHPEAGRDDNATVTQWLRDHEIDREASTGISVRSPTGAMVNDNALRDAVLANDTLCRQVFRPLTKTPIDDLSIGLLSGEEYDQLHQTLQEQEEILSGEWVDKAVGKVEETVSQALGERYEYEVAIASSDGRDVMLVKEPQFGMHYFYSWNTADRRPLLEIDGEPGIPTISPEEIPSAERVEALREICLALQQAPEVGIAPNDEEHEEPQP